MGRIKDFYEMQERLAAFFSEKYKKEILREDIFNSLALLLADKENLEWLGWLEDVDINYDQARELLSGFDFDTLNRTIQTSDDILPIWCLFQFRARFKVNNLIWTIHKYDAHPFPSNPHAHELTQNIKLDLSNGNCFRVRKLIHTLSKKDLLTIRETAIKVYKDELPNLEI